MRTILSEITFSRQMLPDTITSRISQTFEAQYRCLWGVFFPFDISPIPKWEPARLHEERADISITSV